MKKENTKIAIYLRTANEDEEQIELQRKLAIAYCEYRKLTPYKIYCDYGYSGTTEQRPAYKRLVNDIKKSKINTVVVTSYDRLSRQMIYFIKKMDNLLFNSKLNLISIADEKHYTRYEYDLVVKAYEDSIRLDKELEELYSKRGGSNA